MGEIGSLINHNLGCQTGRLICSQTPKRSKTFIRQYAGTGNDSIRSFAVLPNGDYVASITTASMYFNGMDLSAYTNGSYAAYGILKIDKNTLAIKGSFWLNGNGKTSNVQGRNTFHLEVVGNIVYFLWGTNGYVTDTRVYAIDMDTMAQVGTSNTNMLMHIGYGCLRYYGGYLYAATWNSVGDTMLYKISLGLLQVSTGQITLPSWNPQLIRDMVVDSSYIYYVTGDPTWPRHVVKATLSTLTLSAWTTYDNGAYTGWDGISLVQSASNIYVVANVSQSYYETLKAFQKSNLARPAGWTDFSRDLLVTGQADSSYDYRGLDFDATGRLWLFGAYKSAFVNKYRIRLIEINPTTGALISEQFCSYADGGEIYNSPNTIGFALYTNRIWLDVDKYAVIGVVGVTLNGFASIGGSESFFILQDAKGSVLTR